MPRTESEMHNDLKARIAPKFVTSHVINGQPMEIGNILMTPDGIGELTSIALGGSQGDAVSVTVYGKKTGSAFRFEEVRLATFKEYITSKTGFGKTDWLWFWLFQAFCILLTFVGIESWNENGWVAIAFVVVMELVLLTMTWANFKGKVR